jgi:hypothetical protein
MRAASSAHDRQQFMFDLDMALGVKWVIWISTRCAMMRRMEIKTAAHNEPNPGASIVV